MSSYIIAGSADKPETGECEAIANEIKSYYKNIDFRIIIKHPKEWDIYIHEILRIYGFKKMYDPIIFTLDGKLIGGIDGFKELAENVFGISNVNNMKNQITPDINIKIVEKEVAAKKKLQKGKKTLEEKISLCLKEKLQDGQIQSLKGYYQSYINNGLQFYVKEEEQLCPPIFVADEQSCPVEKEFVIGEQLDLGQIAANDQQVIETQQDEEGSQMNKSMNSQNANKEGADQVQEGQQTGRTNNEEKAQTSRSQNEDKPQTARNEGEGGEQKVEGEQQQQQQEGETKEGGEEENKEQQEGQEQDEQAQQQQQQEQEQQEQEPEEPEQEDIVNNVTKHNKYNRVDLKDTFIKKLKDDYFLAFHPYPLLDGQILLFEQLDDEKTPTTTCTNQLEAELNNEQAQNNQEEQQQQQEQQNQVMQQQDGIYILDWSQSLKHRKLKKNYKKKKDKESVREPVNSQASLKAEQFLEDKQDEPLQEDQLQEDEGVELDKNLVLDDINNQRKFRSKLNRDQVQLDKPLSKHDWKQVKKLLKKIECIITFQILPFGHKNHIPLSNNVLNVYLRNFLTRANKNEGLLDVLEDYNKNEQEIQVELLPFEKYIQDLQGQAGKLKKIGDFVQIPNLEFEHLIYMFGYEKVKSKTLKKKFKEMINMVYSEQDLLEYGINCVITKQFIMIVPLRGAYGTFEGKPLYLNPISYMGYIHIPILSKIWPNSAYQNQTDADRKEYNKLLNNQIENTIKLELDI